MDIKWRSGRCFWSDIGLFQAWPSHFAGENISCPAAMVRYKGFPHNNGSRTMAAWPLFSWGQGHVLILLPCLPRPDIPSQIDSLLQAKSCRPCAVTCRPSAVTRRPRQDPQRPMKTLRIVDINGSMGLHQYKLTSQWTLFKPRPDLFTAALEESMRKGAWINSVRAWIATGLWVGSALHIQRPSTQQGLKGSQSQGAFSVFNL